MDGVKFDFSGFTRKYTVDEVAQVSEEEKLTWAFAGLSKSIENIPIIIADSSNPSSLEEMVKQGRVVPNCVSPNQFYGEPVVKACIEAGTHHLDISGEPQYLEKMQLLYNAKVKEHSVFVIAATGFDSILTETGILYTQKQFKDREMASIESFMIRNSRPEGVTIITGTFESTVRGFAHMKVLRPLRQALFPDPLPKYETVLELLATGRIKKPIEFSPFFCVDSLLQVVGLVTFLVMSLLLKYPLVFSLRLFKKGGQTQKQMKVCSFRMICVGCDKAECERSGMKPTAPAEYLMED
ncbi:unnamed protein product [Candidula unifasciata]|uniref:Saccharopine dehydrogenase NADP binding domain-containing protein n=1 Tax=Candidula unifasciata TaxID=100452 RepID=A0A8S3Z2F7_9EUPU|nr:unnamed protein product [Candidula unifasciata]